MSSSKITCFLCGSFAGGSFSDVVRHIGYVHAFDPNFTVTCGLHGCKRQYKTFGAYRVHLYKAHGSVMKDGLAEKEPLPSLPNPPTCTSSLDDMDVIGKRLILSFHERVCLLCIENRAVSNVPSSYTVHPGTCMCVLQDYFKAFLYSYCITTLIKSVRVYGSYHSLLILQRNSKTMLKIMNQYSEQQLCFC